MQVLLSFSNFLEPGLAVFAVQDSIHSTLSFDLTVVKLRKALFYSKNLIVSLRVNSAETSGRRNFFLGKHSISYM